MHTYLEERVPDYFIICFRKGRSFAIQMWPRPHPADTKDRRRGREGRMEGGKEGGRKRKKHREKDRQTGKQTDRDCIASKKSLN